MEQKHTVYSKNNITIINADCGIILDELPSNYFDLIITSPPYNKMKQGGVLVRKIEYDSHYDAMEEDQYQEWQINIINKLYRVLQPNGMLFYNHKVRYYKNRIIHPITFLSKTNFVIWQEIIWDRGISGNIRGWRFFNVEERIYWMVKKIPKELPTDLAKYSNIWRIQPKANQTIHPAPFTEELVSLIVRTGETLIGQPLKILDPFAGICTVGLVAKKRQHECVCIEISKNYCDYGVSMIDNTPIIPSIF